MNQQISMSSESYSEAIRKTCPKCGDIRETAETHCSSCGKPLQKVSTVRALGVFLVAVGAGLLVFMSYLSLWMYQTISHNGDPNASNHFHGEAKDMLFIIFVFGLVISISLGALAGGTWQIIFGKRNKLLAFAVIFLGIIFAVTGMAVEISK